MSDSNREFVLEASGQIERLSDGFVELQRDGFDRGTLDDLFRVAHTLKGNCAAEGFEVPADTAHALEDLLDEVRSDPGAFEDAYVDTALEALDALERQLMEIQSSGAVETDATEIVAAVRELVPDDAGDGGEDAGKEADPDLGIDEIEVPEVDPEEDVSVEEALENAAVFDDLDALEGTVETNDVGDVEGVGLFDDDAASATESDEAAQASDEANASTGAGGVTSSTRSDTGVVPGEDSYADMLSDTTRADPDDLQADLEDVTFGEFDDDDDLSIGELVDMADDVDGATERDDELAGGESLPDDPEEPRDADVFSLGDDAADATDAVDAGSPTSGAGSESASDDELLAGTDEGDDGDFEFGSTDVEAAGFETPDVEPTTGADDVAEPAASDESTVATSTDESNTPPWTDDAVKGTPGEDADASPSDAGVSDIVDRIERLEEAGDGDGGDAVDDDQFSLSDDETALDSSASPESSPASGAGGESLGIDLSEVDGGDDELSAAFDAAAEAGATPEEPDVVPSDVPDVESILEETEFDDVEDVEFATAEFYDRVGFETDSSTGAFVAEFDEAFTDDALGVDVDRVDVDPNAASTIDPELLDAEPEETESSGSSLDTVREVTLDVDEADELLELTEELVVDTQRLAGALGELPPEAADALASLRDVSARIEDHVSNVRLVPLEEAFGGLSRTSRRVARSQDKEVTFLTENGEVEVDRQVVDELADPLVHLVRNAIDHGIEPPEERVSKGKSPEGTVLVRAERDGDAITVAVEDDGRGVDPDDLRAAAVEAGRYTEAEAAALDRDEALELMFDAGLSTTDEVTEVSGRGVGLDVVADVVARLEGTLDVRSEPDVGTTVELTLPVSVALSEVLTVAVDGQRFGLPATEVRRVQEFAPERVDGDRYRLLTGEDDHEHVRLVDLADALDLGGSGGEAVDSGSATAATDVLVLTTGPEPTALRCRDVVDWESVVVQPFDGVLRDHDRVRGAALLGDGSPVVVLEPTTLGGDR